MDHQISVVNQCVALELAIKLEELDLKGEVLSFDLPEETQNEKWGLPLLPIEIMDEDNVSSYLPEIKTKKRSFKFKSPNWNF